MAIAMQMLDKQRANSTLWHLRKEFKSWDGTKVNLNTKSLRMKFDNLKGGECMARARIIFQRLEREVYKVGKHSVTQEFR